MTWHDMTWHGTVVVDAWNEMARRNYRRITRRRDRKGEDEWIGPTFYQPGNELTPSVFYPLPGPDSRSYWMHDETIEDRRLKARIILGNRRKEQIKQAKVIASDASRVWWSTCSAGRARLTEWLPSWPHQLPRWSWLRPQADPACDIVITTGFWPCIQGRNLISFGTLFSWLTSKVKTNTYIVGLLWAWPIYWINSMVCNGGEYQ
jgi:hypothetical protein